MSDFAHIEKEIELLRTDFIMPKEQEKIANTLEALLRRNTKLEAVARAARKYINADGSESEVEMIEALDQLQESKTPCDHTGPIGVYVKNGTKHCVECFQPLYDCLDCGKRIIQSGTPIQGTDVLGYYRYCENCRDSDDQLQEREA